MIDTLTFINDSISKYDLSDSLIQIVNRIEFIYPENSAKLLFGMPSELASILIPTIVALIVFGLGLFFQWRSKKFDKLQVLTSYKTVIVEWTILTQNTISIQNDLYQKFAQELKNQENILPISFLHEPFLIDRLNELNLKELVDLIVLNQKGDKNANALTLLNIVSEIQKLTNIEKSVKEKYLEFLDYTRLLMEQWNTNLKQLDNYMRCLPIKSANSSNASERKFFQNFSQVYNEFNFKADKTITSKNRAEKLIASLEKVCNEFIKDESTISEPNTILPILIELLFTEYRWTVYREGIVQYFLDASKNTKKTYLLLKDNIEQLDKLEFKKWCKIQ